ncbi:MAG: YcaO-like family protein [Anderseniella sp.]|nr:YcaO-like family protein [Anderseniella sp.]
MSRLRPHFSALGITRLGELTGLDNLGLPIAFATRPNSLSLSVSLGKGADLDSALVSAAMEAAETAIAEVTPKDLVKLSAREARNRGFQVVDLDRIARCHPHRLNEDDKISWIEALNMISGERFLVPWSLVGLDHRLSPPNFNNSFYVTSDGLASGNSRGEAVFHGICELIERDALASWQFAGDDEIRRSQLTVTGDEDPRLPVILEAISASNSSLRVYEMRTDTGIPCVMAILGATSRQSAAATSATCGGCGCHPSFGHAIVKAVTEAAQARLALVAGARDDFSSSHYEPADAIRLPAADNANQPSLPKVARTATRRSGNGTPDIDLSVTDVAATLARVGVDQLFAVELPAQQFGISAVRVIATELQVPLQGERVQVTPRGLRNLKAAAA